MGPKALDATSIAIDRLGGERAKELTDVAVNPARLFPREVVTTQTPPASEESMSRNCASLTWVEKLFMQTGCSYAPSIQPGM